MSAKKSATKKYEHLTKPRTPAKGGVFEMKAKAGDKLGKQCIACGCALHYRAGRKPIICRKRGCFKAYRNGYRRDWDKARAAA